MILFLIHLFGIDKVPPVATITSSTITHDSFSKDEYIDVSFTISEDVENFDASSVTITNGYLTDFAGSERFIMVKYILMFLTHTQIFLLI